MNFLSSGRSDAMPKKIFGSGLITADHIFIKEKKDSEPEYLGTSGGGSIGNTLSLLTLLGHDCEVFGIVGNNTISDIIRSDFDLFRISSSLLVKRGKPNQYVKSRQYSHLITVYNNSHSFKGKCLHCGENFSRDFQMSKRDLTDKVKKNAKNSDIIHLDRVNNITFELASLGEKNNIPVTIDLGYTLFRREQDIIKLLEKATITKINKDIFKKLVGNEVEKSLEKWQELFPNHKLLIVSDGENGVYGYSAFESRRYIFHENAIKCKQVRDEGGAGDVLMAVLISELLCKNVKKSKENVLKSIKRGQALASINCSLYGARALQRVLLRQKILDNEIINLADDIINEGVAGSIFTPKLGLPQPIKYSFRFVPETNCWVCGSPTYKKQIKKKIGSISQHSAYIKNLSKSVLVMSESFNSGLLQRNALERYRKSPVIFVGSGGSYSAATFGEEILLKYYGLTSKALPPFHLENIRQLDSKNPICLLSYGGKNADISKGAVYRIIKSKITSCLVLCGEKKSKLIEVSRKNNWDIIELPGKERRGFVSTAGILAMVSSLISLLIPDEAITEVRETFDYENLVKLMNMAEKWAAEESNKIDKTTKIHIVCLASGWGIPALTDFESKIVEGGICTIEIAEMKNFTHGRYINTFHNSHSCQIVLILFESPDEKELTDYIKKKFQRHINSIIIARTEKEGVSGALELMIKSLYLAWHIGRKKGKDISSPQYPPQARGLYGWEPMYRDQIELETLIKES